MTRLPAMYLWTDAYLADTGHLTTFEHGAYLLILMAMWRAGGSLPNTEITLARTARTTIDRWRKIAPTIHAMLTIEGDRITQKRLRAELTASTERLQRLSARGKTGGLAKSLKNNVIHLPKARIMASNQNHKKIDSSLRSESMNQSASADSCFAEQNASACQPDFFGEKKTKKIVRAEQDEDLLDKITDVWNPWAATHRARQVKALTEKRATLCRKAIGELMKLEGITDPFVAFSRLLDRCNESFFVLGDPDHPLTFNQLMGSDFMPRMLCGEFAYEKPNGKGRGKW
jgi:uncharacterized protein YdaU (DUF1376 family)